MHGVGKMTALKIFQNKYMLSTLGTEVDDLAPVISESTAFIAACYGCKEQGNNISEVRYSVWSSKMANHNITACPKLKSLPPTHDAFVQHVYRSHYQVRIWLSAMSADPPALNPINYGWAKIDDRLSPVTLPDNVSPVPLAILQFIKCGCSAERPCSSSRCSCVVAQMSCSLFCKCHAHVECCNEHTKSVTAENYDSDVDDDDYDGGGGGDPATDP